MRSSQIDSALKYYEEAEEKLRELKLGVESHGLTAAYRRLHYARLQASFDADHGDAVAGARAFIGVAVSELAGISEGPARLYFWKPVICDAEELLLSDVRFTDAERFSLSGELRMKMQMALDANTTEPVTKARVRAQANAPLREKVKELWGLAGNSNAGQRCLFVCRKLDVGGLKPPATASWKHLGFTKAYQDDKHRSAVQKMITNLRK